MTEWLRQWMTGVTAAALLLSAAEALVRGKGLKRVCRLCGGFVLLLAVLGPLRQVDVPELTLFAEDYLAEAEKLSEQLSEQNDELYQSIIEAETAAYITNMAEETGLSCAVRVVCQTEGAGEVPVYEVWIEGIWTDEAMRRLTTRLAEELQITPERQHYERTEP